MFTFMERLHPTPNFPYFKARNGGRRSRSAAKPQSDRWRPKRFAPIIASLRSPFGPHSPKRYCFAEN